MRASKWAQGKGCGQVVSNLPHAGDFLSCFEEVGNLNHLPIRNLFESCTNDNI